MHQKSLIHLLEETEHKKKQRSHSQCRFLISGLECVTLQFKQKLSVLLFIVYVQL